jgi:hypothetical protein
MEQLAAFNVHNEPLAALACELMANWAAHADLEMPVLVRFAHAVNFDVMLSLGCVALKEKALRALRQLAARLGPQHHGIVTSWYRRATTRR